MGTVAQARWKRLHRNSQSLCTFSIAYGIMDLSVRESLEGGTEMAELTSGEKQFLAGLYYCDDGYLELDWKKLKGGDKAYCGILGSLCKKHVISEEEDYCFIVSSEYEHMIDKPLKFRVAQVLASGSLRIGKFDLAYEDACDIAKKLSDKKFKFIVVDSIGTPVE